jgi:hypothetical protein
VKRKKKFAKPVKQPLRIEKNQFLLQVRPDKVSFNKMDFELFH